MISMCCCTISVETFQVRSAPSRQNLKIDEPLVTLHPHAGLQRFRRIPPDCFM
jgi:hypothetical protein